VAPVGGTGHLVAQSDIDESLDPAFVVNGPQITYATCANLITYPDRPGPAGLRLVPEVAQSLPTRSSDGTTYSFVIRKGFRFSPPSNQPVTAQTFKYTLERTLSPRIGSFWADYFDDIVGAPAYRAGKTGHVAGIGASGNRLVIHLRAPAGDLLARLATPAACAVPVGTPHDPGGVRLVPSAGPYFVTSYIPGQGAVLQLNPTYRGQRPHRLGRIEITFGVSARKALAEIESGSADYALGPDALPASALPRLGAVYGPRSPAAKRGRQRYFLSPRPSVHFLLLNTHRPLFREARLRRAASYAIDRQALARIGAPFQSATEPTDLYLPPGLPGSAHRGIYRPTPDIAAARRLAGSTRRRAILYACNTSTCGRLAQEVKRDLEAIGIEVAIKLFPSRSLTQRYAAHGEAYDLALASWFPDYADPAAALDVVAVGGSGLPTPNLDPRYARRLAEAAKLSGPGRYFAYEQLNVDLVRDAAPWIAYAYSVRQDFFSARMGCQISQPVYGIDIAALCIRR
jgi:peptide/nickel transport system substrate-binding protein